MLYMFAWTDTKLEVSNELPSHNRYKLLKWGVRFFKETSQSYCVRTNFMTFHTFCLLWMKKSQERILYFSFEEKSCDVITTTNGSGQHSGLGCLLSLQVRQAPKQKSTVLAMVSPEFRRHPGLAAATHTEDQRWTETATGGTCTLSPLWSGTKVTQSGEPAVKFQWKGRSELILCRRLLLGDEVTPKGARESRPQWNQKPGHSWDRKPPEQGGYSWKAWLRRQCLAPLKAALKSATASRAW